MLLLTFIIGSPILSSLSSISSAMNSGKFDIISAKTIADSISVDVPSNGYLAKKNLENFGKALYKLRDSENISLDKISKITKIDKKYLRSQFV